MFTIKRSEWEALMKAITDFQEDCGVIVDGNPRMRSRGDWERCIYTRNILRSMEHSMSNCIHKQYIKVID